MKISVGIDLGTTYSCVATFSSKDGKTLILKNSMGKETTPSVIKIDNGNVLIGDDAKGEQKNGDLNTAAFYKSMMGDSSYSAFIDGKEYSAEDLSYLFLKSLKEDIEKANNVEIGSSVITVPAYFNEKQRNATLNAGNRAGLNVLKIINEPTSAIIAYGLNSGNDKNVLVYDLGGGTFDVTVAHVSGNKIDVLVTNGNHQLGGKDWDQVLLDTFKDAFYAEEGINVEDYPEELKELQIKCEDAKKRLSSVPSTTISMQVNGIMGKADITREEFDDKTSSLLNETFLLVDTCFKELSEQLNKPFSWNDIDEVVLVGGSTRMPQVKERVLSEYGKAPFTKDINVDTIVANGAALQAEICINNQITLTVTEKVNGVLQKKLCTISKSDISDITSHSLGMLANDASGKNFVNSIIIPKNSKINQKFVKEFSFAGKNLDVYILQGESREPTENDLLGKYIISKGTNSSSKIKVEYLYNQNGIVEVNGYDENGNKLEVKKEEVTDSISTVIEKIKNQKPSISRLEVIVSIDTSGSMDTGDAIGKSKAAFLDMLSSFDSSLTYICLSEFGEGERVVVPFTNEYSNIKSKISDLGTGGVGYGTSCHISDTCAHFTNKADAKVLIILTDGIWENEDKARRESTIAKDSHITIYAIGIGSANERFLKDISSDGNGQKIDISNLSQAFQDVACSIASEIGGGRIS